MSRREEVEATWDHWGCGRTSIEVCELALDLARTLADEVDAITAERDSLARRINPDGVPVDVAALCLEIDTVTDEVDSLRASLTALGEKATRYEHEREVNAGLVAERDAAITKLLEMLEPGVAPPKSHQACSCFDCRQHEINEGRYNRALEIAGRNG